MEPDELRHELSGLLSFPVTPFTDEGTLDLPRLREHVAGQLETDARAVFVACGTGELFSLDLDEHEQVVRAAVEVAAGAKPVIAGVGHGWPIAQQMARAAARAGADGLLALPPYLVRGDQDGLFAHYERIAAATDLGLIVYQRDNAVFAPRTVRRLSELPTVIGVKDALGDLDHLARIRVACDDELAFMNGMPTAEMTAAAYAACGVASYSSAVLNFVPEVACAYHRAFAAGDAVTADRLLAGFFVPFVELRDQRPGYAVSLVKAGIAARGKPVGEVRPPLTGPDAAHRLRLAAMIDHALALV